MGLPAQAALVLLVIAVLIFMWSYVDWRRKRNRFVGARRVIRMYVADPPSSDCQRNYVP